MEIIEMDIFVWKYIPIVADCFLVFAKYLHIENECLLLFTKKIDLGCRAYLQVKKDSMLSNVSNEW
jgi:hypothetical protein